MKAIVLYRSLSGFTRKYAGWIAEELGADLFDCREVEPPTLAGYGLIVFCGSLHKGGINGIDAITRNFALLSPKRVIVLVTGGSSARPGLEEEIMAANFPVEQRSRLRLFYLRGGFDFRKLTLKDKALMLFRIGGLRLKRAEDLTSDDRDLLAARSNPADATSKDNLKPLLEYARSPGLARG